MTEKRVVVHVSADQVTFSGDMRTRVPRSLDLRDLGRRIVAAAANKGFERAVESDGRIVFRRRTSASAWTFAGDVALEASLGFTNVAFDIR